MSDSWIDKDELDEFVGAFSKKKRQQRRRSAKQKELSPFEPDTDELEEEEVVEASAETRPTEEQEQEPAEETIEEEAAVEEIAADESPAEDETKPITSGSVTVQVVKLDENSNTQDEELAFEDDLSDETANEFIDSDEPAEELAAIESEADNSEEELSEFGLASDLDDFSEEGNEPVDVEAETEEPIQSSVLDEIFPASVSDDNDGIEGLDDSNSDGIEDASYDVATVPGLEISSPFISDNMGTPIDALGIDENLEDAFGHGDSLSDETISHIEVSDSTPRDEVVEHTPHFLGDISTPDTEEPESKSEVGRAIRTLADARERANASSLLKTDTHYSVADSEPVSEIDEYVDEETDSPLLATLQIESIGPLQQRVYQFAELAHRELSDPRVSISDVDGVYLYRDELFEMSISEELRMIRTLQIAGEQSGLKKVSGSQVSDGDGRWHAVVMAHGAEARLLAHFDLAEPLDPPLLEEWSKVLAEAVDPANASS